jgi:hypothetical protein
MILQQAYVDDKKAKVSSNDTTPGYLNGKLTAGTGVSLTEGSDGGDETLSIANIDTGSGAVSAHTGTYDHTLLHSPVTIVDSASVDFTLSGQQITAVVAASGVDHNSLNNLTVGDPHTQYQKESEFTPGSVLFRGKSAITEDNSGLFYTEATKRLGIGVALPSASIHVRPPSGENGIIRIQPTYDPSTDNRQMSLLFLHNNNAYLAKIVAGYDTDATDESKYKDLSLFVAQSGSNIRFFTANTEIGRFTFAGNFGINTTAPARRIESLDTTNPQLRLTHTAGSVYAEAQATSAGYMELNATGNRILLGKDDSDKAYFGAGYDFSLYYDGTSAYLKTDEVAASDLHLTTGADKSLVLENGLLALKETTTPTAVADYGRIYTKSDNKLYFQDGAGTEHEIQFV